MNDNQILPGQRGIPNDGLSEERLGMPGNAGVSPASL